MRRATLLYRRPASQACAAALLLTAAVFLGAPSSAMAQGGSAVCSGATQVARAQTVGGLALEAGPYEITVRETGDLTCDQAREAFREILAEPGENLPDGWQVDLTARSFAREDGSDAFTINPVVPPIAADGGGVSERGEVGGRGRRGGVEGRAARGGRVPARPEALPEARRPRAEGDPAARPARHRQDAAREGGGQRVEGGVLRPVGLVGFDERDEIVVIAASNLLDKLDPALLRPGRFDRQIFVAPPDLKGRRSILQVHTRNKPLAKGIDLEMVARQTSGLTGADLANLCNEAAIFAGRDRRAEIQTRDFQAALERVIAGVQSRRVISDHEKRVVAYHEAGHALCSELLPSVEKVHRISIIPRGKALGYTLNLPEEDRYLKTRDELLDYLVVLLGGRVTEHIVFGQVTTGASDDLRKVHDISRSMVTMYGMGTELVSKQLPADDYAMSDHTRRMVDEEQQYLTDLAHRRALKLVAENRMLLESFAFTLLQNEVLEREDIEQLVLAYRGQTAQAN